MGSGGLPHVSTAPSSPDTRAKACSAHTPSSAFCLTPDCGGGHSHAPFSNQPSEPPGVNRDGGDMLPPECKGMQEKEAIPKVQDTARPATGGG